MSQTGQKNTISSEKIAEIEQKKTNLEQEQKDLEQEIQRLDVEEVIRDEFLMKKPGEYVVQVTEKKEVLDQNKSQEQLISKNIWQKWKKILF